MSTIEALRNRIFTRAAIDFSQSVELFSSINSAARLIGRDMKGPEIRAAHDKIALVVTRAAQAAIPILEEMARLDREIEAQKFLTNFFQRQGKTDYAEWFEKKSAKNKMELDRPNQPLENIGRAAGLTLNDYDFSRSNLFPGGWGLVVFAQGKAARRWNKFALLVPWDGEGEETVQEVATGATAIEISLAQLSSPYPEAPAVVKAKMAPLVTIDVQGIKLEQPKAPHVYKIYNAQHVVTTIKPPFLSPRLVYAGK